MDVAEATALAARYLRPERAQLAAAHAAIAGVTESAEAWETLATRHPVGCTIRPVDGPLQRTQCAV